MNLRIRYSVSMLMILLVLSLSATCFCSDDATAGTFTGISSSDCGDCTKKAGTPCQSGDSDPTGHCESSCHCTCHAPLTAQPLSFACVRHVTPLTFAEPYKALPEVYLSKFIPPHEA